MQDNHAMQHSVTIVTPIRNVVIKSCTERLQDIVFNTQGLYDTVFNVYKFIGM